MIGIEGVENVISSNKRSETIKTLKNIRSVFKSLLDTGIKTISYSQGKQVVSGQTINLDKEISKAIDEIFDEITMPKKKTDDIKFLKLNVNQVVKDLDNNIGESPTSNNKQESISKQDKALSSPNQIKRLLPKGQIPLMHTNIEKNKV